MHVLVQCTARAATVHTNYELPRELLTKFKKDWISRKRYAVENDRKNSMICVDLQGQCFNFNHQIEHDYLNVYAQGQELKVMGKINGIREANLDKVTPLSRNSWRMTALRVGQSRVADKQWPSWELEVSMYRPM
jgi:hypothetical protein